MIRTLPAGYKGPLAVGDTVLCSFDACGSHCTSCNTGYPAACHSFFPRIFWGLKLDGSTTDCYADADKKEKINLGFFGQSSFMRTGIVNLGSMIKVDAGLPLPLLCAFGCGIMTGFGTVLNKLLPAPEKSFSHLPDYASLNLPKVANIADPSPKTIVIFGMGAVGMGAVVGARVAKIANIIAVDMVDERLQLAKEAGATHVISAKLSAEDLLAEIKKISPDGAGANLSLEASGSGAALKNAIECLAPLGKCAGVGAPKPGLTIDIDMNAMVATNRTYMGVLLGTCLPAAISCSSLPSYACACIPRRRLQHFHSPALHGRPLQAGRFCNHGKGATMQRHGNERIADPRPYPQLVKTYKPENMEQALADSKSGKVVKPVIAW